MMDTGEGQKLILTRLPTDFPKSLQSALDRAFISGAAAFISRFY